MLSLRDLRLALLDASGGAFLRYLLVLRRAQKDEIGTRKSAQCRNVAILQPTDLDATADDGKSGELFILGSGPSALELTHSKKERMRAGTTIGLNSWALHDFIPDAYSFEEMEDDNYLSVARGLSSMLRQPTVLASKPLILHLRSRTKTPTQRLVSVPQALEKGIRYYGRVRPETKEVRNLESDLASILRAQLSGAIAPSILIDNGMSVARMISLGILRGFSKIVLVGVDLNSSRYFFEIEPSFLSRHNLSDFNPWISRSLNHDTEETENRNFPASVFLPALANAARAVTGVEVLVGSANSKLANNLEVFSW